MSASEPDSIDLSDIIDIPPQPKDHNGIRYLYSLPSGGIERFDFNNDFRSYGKRFSFNNTIGQPAMEIGGYFSINTNNNNANAEIIGEIYGGNHNNDNPEHARCYVIGLNFDGKKVTLKKENEHPNTGNILESVTLSFDAYNDRWIGVRFVCFNTNNNTNVRIVTLLDNLGLYISNKPINYWRVIADWTDTGQYPFGPYVAYPFGNNVSRQTIRIDQVGGSNDLDWKGVFFRHIDPNNPMTNLIPAV